MYIYTQLYPVANVSMVTLNSEFTSVYELIIGRSILSTHSICSNPLITGDCVRHCL